MNDHLKYIIVESRGLPIPIIFPAILDHAEVAGDFSVVSAGFVAIHSSIYGENGKIQVSCWGESQSLKKLGKNFKYSPDDADIISRELERPHR
jgi:hypothetical protein